MSCPRSCGSYRYVSVVFAILEVLYYGTSTKKSKTWKELLPGCPYTLCRGGTLKSKRWNNCWYDHKKHEIRDQLSTKPGVSSKGECKLEVSWQRNQRTQRFPTLIVLATHQHTTCIVSRTSCCATTADCSGSWLSASSELENKLPLATDRGKVFWLPWCLQISRGNRRTRNGTITAPTRCPSRQA
jgi:hypothetical protein